MKINLVVIFVGIFLGGQCFAEKKPSKEISIDPALNGDACVPVKAGQIQNKAVEIKGDELKGRAVDFGDNIVWPQIDGLLAVDKKYMTVKSVELTGLSTTLIVGSRTLCMGTYDGHLKCFDKNFEVKVDFPLATHIYALGAFETGGYVASVAPEEKKGELWLLNSVGAKDSVLGEDQALAENSIIPIGHHILAATNQTVYIVDSKKGVLSRQNLNPPQSFQHVFQFGKDRAFVTDNKGYIYSFTESGLEKIVPVYTKEVLRIQHMDQKGHTILVKTAEGQIALFDIKTAKEIIRVKLDAQTPGACASLSGGRMACHGDGNSVVVLDSSGKTISSASDDKTFVDVFALGSTVVILPDRSINTYKSSGKGESFKREQSLEGGLVVKGDLQTSSSDLWVYYDKSIHHLSVATNDIPAAKGCPGK